MSKLLCLSLLLCCCCCCVKWINASGTCTLSQAGVGQIAAAVAALATQTSVNTIGTTVGTTATAVTAIGVQTTAIGVQTTSIETTVNGLATDTSVTSFLATSTPILFSAQAAGYAASTFGWTSSTVLPWSAATFLVTNWCALNGGAGITGDWLLDAAANTATTIAAFPLIVASIASSLPPAASYDLRVVYNDACPGPGFTYGALTGTCCIAALNHDYVYNTLTGVFTCSDQTTPVYPVCVTSPTGTQA